ncbi:MAG: TRAP transporter small permease subunit [Spirochaetaceae bacterium]
MEKAISTLKKIYLRFCKAEEIVCGVGLMLLVALVFLSAVLRFMRFSVSWNLDLSMLLLAWTAFLGADVAWRSGQVIGVNLVTRNLPKSLQQIISIFINLFVLVALVLIFYYGIKLSWTERLARYQSMAIPYSLVTISLVVASFSMIFTTLQKLQIIILEMSGKLSSKVLLSDNKGE